MDLPTDLLSAEAQLFFAVGLALKAEAKGRWTAEMRFEGLRILPVALRLLEQFHLENQTCHLIFPDAGACALAQRDAPAIACSCSDFASWQKRQAENQEISEHLIVLVAPGPPDYKAVESVCRNHRGPVLLLNGRLEDAAVGIGSVARNRRKGFLSTWINAYCLQPLVEAVLLHAYPNEWLLFKQTAVGFKQVAVFEQKPAPGQLDEALNDPLGQGLKAIDRFLNQLS